MGSEGYETAPVRDTIIIRIINNLMSYNYAHKLKSLVQESYQ